MTKLLQSPLSETISLPIDSKDIHRAIALIQRKAGIIIGEHKHDSAARILSIKAKNKKFKGIKNYLDELESNPNSLLWEDFINAFTINHTAFYREKHHFDILEKFIKSRGKPIDIWSCASSTGEEPYSIAMTALEALNTPYGCSILATDIDTKALDKARKGVYSFERVKGLDTSLLRKFFFKGSGTRTGQVMLKPNVKELITFDRLNLVDPDWSAIASDRLFDAIFCRNTMIYFDTEDQKKILERFSKLLKPGGLLFAGHSENFTYISSAFSLKGQTVYSVASGGKVK